MGKSFEMLSSDKKPEEKVRAYENIVDKEKKFPIQELFLFIGLMLFADLRPT